MKKNNAINNINLNGAWASYKINYCYGLPGINCFVRGIRLYVLPNGLYFYIAAKRSAFRPFYLEYSRIKSIEFPKGSGSTYYSIFLINKFDTDVQIIFFNGTDEIAFRFEFSEVLGNPAFNQGRCQDFYMLLKNHRIFERLACPVQSAGNPNSVSENKADIFAQIEKLGELHKSGVLTDEEFQKKKEELLKRI